MRSRSSKLRNLSAALALMNLSTVGSMAVAGDKTWDNGSTDGLWNTSSLNWTGTAWNNANGDGAIFAGSGLGTVSVPGSISVNSLNFSANGYTISGAGSLDFVSGVSTQGTGVINVTSGTTQINVPISSSQTLIKKIGAGVLELSQPLSISGNYQLFNNPILSNIVIGSAPAGNSPVGGTLRVLNTSVLPTSAKVMIGPDAYLDIGSNNVTIGQLAYTNNANNTAYDTFNNRGGNGPIGSGNLRVLGDIWVTGVTGGNLGPNFINTGLDLGGGNQVIHISSNGSGSLNNALVITGVVSNGSLTKTLGFNQGSSYAAPDGMTLMANNTYTGSTRFNSGTNVITGTNASSSLMIVGPSGFPGSFVTLQGANGSFLSANTLQAYSGGTLILDNNVAIAAGVLPAVPAAQNNNRISDTANIELRDGNFTYRGLASATATETFGSMSVTGGHNVVTLTPNNVAGGGTVTITNNGNLTLDPRSTLQVGVLGTGAVLGTNSRYLVNGTVPAASGGIIPRMTAGTTDFIFYDNTNGFTPLPAGSYSSSLSAGTNVNLTAATSTSGSVSVNALKMTGSFATTISSGDTLNIATGMMLATGTHTINGPGTLDFGSTPGVIFGSTTFAATSVVTGTQGIVHATGTLTLNGNLAGLTGTLSNIGTGTMALNTNTFTGPIEVRRGTLNIGTNLSGSSAITLGVSNNVVDLMPSNPTLSISAAGAGAVISRPIVVDNGATNMGGLTLDRFSYLPLLQPLSNSSGSQTLNSNITLNSSLNFQGGGAGGVGSTTFGGDITGNGTFVFANGRASFTGNYTNAGGFYINSGGFTSIVTFAGTGGSGPIVLNQGSNSTSGISYASQTNLGSSVITVQNSSGANAPTVTASANSSINNTVNLNGDVFVSVPTGVTAIWAGQLTGTGALTKNNTGTLALSNNSNTQTGPVTVSAGTLAVNGNIASSASPVTVNSGGTLGGSGTISRTVTVNTGGSLAPGNSPGNLTVDGNVTLASGSSFKVEANGTSPGVTYDMLTVAGVSRTFTITNAVLSPTTTSSTLLSTDTMYIAVLNDAASSIAGTFSGIAQDGTIYVIGFGSGMTYSAQVSYTGDFGSGAVTGGNDIVLYNFAFAVPEPTTIALVGLLGMGAAGGWYYRRRRLLKAMEVEYGRRR